MKLTPREKDKLMIRIAANVARKRLEKINEKHQNLLKKDLN